MEKQIIRSGLLIGTKADFERVIRGMSAIRGVPGINEGKVEFWISPETASVVHLVRVEDRTPLEDWFYFYMTLYNPRGRGFTKSGHKIIRLGRKTYELPLLLALTFVPCDDSNKVVGFKNGNRRDLRASNIVWVSRAEAHKRKRKVIIKLKLNKSTTGRG